ncbi:MAG TPA: hypothetical protein VJQ83_02465 [Tepidiformaceae bacterium]|nr:hypothetical protein [Tepidiformaceae bacterium]
MRFIFTALAAVFLLTASAQDPPAYRLGTRNAIASAAGPAAVAQALVDLPDNTVLDLGPFSPTIPGGETLDEVRQAVGFSGLVYDQPRRRMVFFGAGHSGSNYDAIWTLPLDTLQQTELYPPTPAQPTLVLSNWDSTLGAWLSGPDGGPYPRPAARHTVDLITATGDELTTYGREEGNGPATQEGINQGNPGATKIFVSASKIWHYSFATGAWTYDAANLTDGWGSLGASWGAVEYDPMSGLVMQIDASYLHTYDPATHVQSGVIVSWNSPAGSAQLVDENGTRVPNTLGINASLSYCALDQNFYWFNFDAVNGQQQVWRFEPDRTNFANSRLVKLATGGTPPPIAANMEYPTRYDTANGVFLAGPFNNVVYVFDPMTKIWSAQAVLGGTPGSVAQNSHVMAYSPEANVYIFVTDTSATPPSHVWAYRYKAASLYNAVEYYYLPWNNYFVTSTPSEITALDTGVLRGWQRTGESFAVYPDGAPQAVPMCRFFSGNTFAPRSTHFFTAYQVECQALLARPDVWTYEGNAMSVLLPDGLGNCPVGARPLYRLYNDGQGGAPNHRYTTSFAIRAAMVAQGWIPEGAGVIGVIACVPG